MNQTLKNGVETFGNIFSDFRYILIAFIVALLSFIFAVLMPNLQLVWQVVSGSYLIKEKILFVFSLLGAITTNFTFFSALYTIIISLLFGMNMAMIVYVIKQRTLKKGSLATSIAGGFSGVLGIGCAACGTLIINSLLPFVGASFIALLPWKGQEFGVVSVLLLLMSFCFIIRSISQPKVCIN